MEDNDEEDHNDVRYYLKTDLDNVMNENVLSEDSLISEKYGNGYAHPNWLMDLKANCDSLVRSWSLKTQEAWINNKKFTIEDANNVRRVRFEIIFSLVDKLFQIH